MLFYEKKNLFSSLKDLYVTSSFFIDYGMGSHRTCLLPCIKSQTKILMNIHHKV